MKLTYELAMPPRLYVTSNADGETTWTEILNRKGERIITKLKYKDFQKLS